jgi:hypothetical protein
VFLLSAHPSVHAIRVEHDDLVAAGGRYVDLYGIQATAHAAG